jgi:hypothetical protein
VAVFDFPNRPTGTISELWQAIWDLLPQLQRKVVKNVTVGTVETPIAHGLKFAPQMGIAYPQADARVWRTRSPDNKFCYFAASASVVCNVEIVP